MTVDTRRPPSVCAARGAPCRARFGLPVLLAGLLLSACGGITAAPEVGFSRAVQRALPSTVGIYATAAADESDDEGRTCAAPRIGAGFLVDADGVVATAAHLLADTTRVVVRSADGRIARAERLAMDEDLDIALLRIPRGLLRLPEFGRSPALRPGDWVLAIGEPFGLGRSVTAGIVGGVERHFAEDDEATFIQSDVAINPGNSGGPLLDRGGAVVGMNVRLVSANVPGSGVTLSLPIETVLQVTRELLRGDAAARPRLQAEFGDVPPLLAVELGRADGSGALVRWVESGGPAARAGLRAGDVVLAVDGQPVRDSAALARRLRNWQAAVVLRLVVARGARRVQLSLPGEAASQPPTLATPLPLND